MPAHVSAHWKNELSERNASDPFLSTRVANGSADTRRQGIMSGVLWNMGNVAWRSRARFVFTRWRGGGEDSCRCKNCAVGRVQTGRLFSCRPDYLCAAAGPRSIYAVQVGTGTGTSTSTSTSTQH